MEQVYIPDLMAIAGFYKDWAAIGGGLKNYLAYGDLPTRGYGQPDYFKFAARRHSRPQPERSVSGQRPRRRGDQGIHLPFLVQRIPPATRAGLHPFAGETEFNYTGPKPPYEQLNVEGKYSWLKTPRWKDHPMEVGPLARMLVSYAKGSTEVKDVVNEALGQLGVPVTALFSTLGRTAARGLETTPRRALDEGVLRRTDRATSRPASFRTFNREKWEPSTWPATAEGVGLSEAPRGALAHWIKIKDGKIDNYQLVVPSTWNASPRDAKGQRSAYEAALIGTPVANVEQPLEILRTIHSFDPCIACAVHLYDPDGKHVHRVQFY